MVIISSPLAFFDGKGVSQMTVHAEVIPFPDDLSGAVSYVGHPATKALLEALGATTAEGRWAGPEVGESYIAIPLANNPREGGWTKDTAIASLGELRAIKLTRIA